MEFVTEETFMPVDVEFTAAEKERLRSWLGRRVYVDEGDSFGCIEMTGILTRVDEHSFTVEDTLFSFDETAHVDLAGA